jgi:hypothetical protein
VRFAGNLQQTSGRVPENAGIGGRGLALLGLLQRQSHPQKQLQKRE